MCCALGSLRVFLYADSNRRPGPDRGIRLRGRPDRQQDVLEAFARDEAYIFNRKAWRRRPASTGWIFVSLVHTSLPVHIHIFEVDHHLQHRPQCHPHSQGGEQRVEKNIIVGLLEL